MAGVSGVPLQWNVPVCCVFARRPPRSGPPPACRACLPECRDGGVTVQTPVSAVRPPHSCCAHCSVSDTAQWEVGGSGGRPDKLGGVGRTGTAGDGREQSWSPCSERGWDADWGGMELETTGCNGLGQVRMQTVRTRCWSGLVPHYWKQWERLNIAAMLWCRLSQHVTNNPAIDVIDEWRGGRPSVTSSLATNVGAYVVNCVTNVRACIMFINKQCPPRRVITRPRRCATRCTVTTHPRFRRGPMVVWWSPDVNRTVSGRRPLVSRRQVHTSVAGRSRSVTSGGGDRRRAGDVPMSAPAPPGISSTSYTAVDI